MERRFRKVSTNDVPITFRLSFGVDRSDNGESQPNDNQKPPNTPEHIEVTLVVKAHNQENSVPNGETLPALLLNQK